MDSHFVSLVQTVVENIQNNQRRQKNETKKFSIPQPIINLLN